MAGIPWYSFSWPEVTSLSHPKNQNNSTNVQKTFNPENPLSLPSSFLIIYFLPLKLLIIIFFFMTAASSEYEELVKKLTDEVINEIEMDIQNRMIEVAEEKTDVNPIIEKKKMKKKSRKSDEKYHKPTLDELREIKQSKLVELRAIERKEETIKKSFVLEKSKISNSCSKLWRSEFTEDEMAEIKKILKSHKQFEKQLLQKQKDLEAWLAEKKEQDEELKKKEIAELCQQRRKVLTKQRQELQHKKQEEAVRLQQEIKKLKQLKAKKWLHQKMLESWKKYEQTSEQQKKRMWALEKEKKKQAAQELHEHEAKYMEMKKDLEKKREQTLQHSRSLKSHFPYIHAQIFYKVQKEEEERAKLEEIKSHEKEDFITKKRLYSKQVSQIFLPKLKIVSSRNESDSTKNSMTKLSFSTEQAYRLGNDYMKSAHQKVTIDQVEKQKKSLIIEKEPAGNSIFYKNYLKEIQTGHQKENTLAAVESTLRNQKLSSTDKLHKIKRMFESEKGKKKTDAQLIETIKSKMKVLQEIIR